MTYFCPHIEVEQRPRYRRASNPTLEVIQRQKCSKITIFYYFAKARVKARSSTSKARSSNTKIEPRLGLDSSSKMKSSNSSKLDNFRLVAPLVSTSFLQPTHVSQLTKRDSLSFTHQNFPSLFYTHLLLEIKGPEKLIRYRVISHYLKIHQ